MLITLEGIDGSGKTTVWEALRNDSGLEADESAELVFTREPTESWYGDAIERSLRSDDADPLAELFLYTADHAAHLSNTVEPALDRGAVVISDRYSDSRYAYQSVALEGELDDPPGFIQSIHQPWTREPDCTIYLDIDAETGAKRSNRANKFEQREFLASVSATYENRIEQFSERFVRVDATQSPDVVLEEVRSILRTQLVG